MTTNVTFLGRIMGGLTDALERSGQKRARNYLLSLSDTQLHEMGLTRKQVEQSPTAWPWGGGDQQDATRLHAVARDNKTSGNEASALDSGPQAQKDESGRSDADTRLAA